MTTTPAQTNARFGQTAKALLGAFNQTYADSQERIKQLIAEHTQQWQSEVDLGRRAQLATSLSQLYEAAATLDNFRHEPSRVIGYHFGKIVRSPNTDEVHKLLTNLIDLGEPYFSFFSTWQSATLWFHHATTLNTGQTKLSLQDAINDWMADVEHLAQTYQVDQPLSTPEYYFSRNSIIPERVSFRLNGAQVRGWKNLHYHPHQGHQALHLRHEQQLLGVQTIQAGAFLKP